VNLLEISFLEEGVLRKNAKGHWYVEQDGRLVPLETLLDRFKNREVRLTCVDLLDASSLIPTHTKGSE
jgi:hypothetical protein